MRSYIFFILSIIVFVTSTPIYWRFNVKDSELPAGIQHAGVTATFLQPVKATPVTGSVSATQSALSPVSTSTSGTGKGADTTTLGEAGQAPQLTATNHAVSVHSSVMGFYIIAALTLLHVL